MQLERLESTKYCNELKKILDQKIKAMTLNKKDFLKKEDDTTISVVESHTLGYFRGYEDAATEIYCMLIGEKFSYNLGKE